MEKTPKSITRKNGEIIITLDEKALVWLANLKGEEEGFIVKDKELFLDYFVEHLTDNTIATDGYEQDGTDLENVVDGIIQNIYEYDQDCLTIEDDEDFEDEDEY